MKLNSTKLGETTTQTQLKERVLSTITEYAEEFEKAMIEVFFIASYSDQGNEIDKDKIDHLHLLYKVLQDAKKISKPNLLLPGTSNILFNKITNS